jgi:hypothetical protein
MAARLPTPGSDDGTWGAILNEYLSQVHKADGTLKDNIVTTTAIAPGAVDETALAPTGGTDGQVLAKDSASPSGMSWQTAVGGTVADASTTAKGIVQLTGDLGGTATAPTVPGLAGKANTTHTHAATDITSGTLAASVLGSGTASSTTYLRGDGTWATPAVGGGDPAMGGDLTGTASNAQLATGVVGATELAANAVTTVKVQDGAITAAKLDTATNNLIASKANTATTYTKTEVDTALAGKANTAHTHTLDSLSDVSASGASDGQSLVFNAGTWGPGTVGTGTSVVDATSSVKGVVQLAGDFGGTAAAPAVTGIRGVAVTTNSPSDGQVLKYDLGTGTIVWGADAAGGGAAVSFVSVTSAQSPYSATNGRRGNCFGKTHVWHQ